VTGRTILGENFVETLFLHLSFTPLVTRTMARMPSRRRNPETA